VIEKLEVAIDKGLDHWLPQLLAGEWNPIPQEEALATYHGKRGPEDGLLDWERPADQLLALIRAASRPHPGAYTYVNNHQLIIWRAILELNYPIKGVPGRILLVDSEKGYLVQTGQGLLWLTEVEFALSRTSAVPKLRVGLKLGYSAQDEIYLFRQRILQLEEKIASLTGEQNLA
jgi:methionyl-tRNA formyltransferase